MSPVLNWLMPLFFFLKKVPDAVAEGKMGLIKRLINKFRLQESLTLLKHKSF